MSYTYYDEAIPYVVGIIRQAGYTIIASGPEYWLDLSAQQLLALFQMLDTHRRRLLRAAGWKTRMGFDPKTAYARILFLGDERVVTTDAQPGQIYIHVKRKTSA